MIWELGGHFLPLLASEEQGLGAENSTLSLLCGGLACPSVGSGDLPVTTTSPTAFFLFEKSFQSRPTHSCTAFCLGLTHSLPDPSSPTHPRPIPQYGQVTQSLSPPWAATGCGGGPGGHFPGPETDPGSSDAAGRGK